MNNPIFDFNCNDLLMPVSDNIAMGLNGNIHLKVSPNMAVDMNTGELHFTTQWDSDGETDQTGGNRSKRGC